MTNQVALRSWGNSLGIRIPQKILKELHIQKDDVLSLETEGDALLIRKAFRHKTFEERVAEYNENVTVEPFDWGEIAGRELL